MTSAPVVDERVHQKVLEALLAAKLGTEPGTNDKRVYDYGTVPGTDDNPGIQPKIYVLLTIERRYARPQRSGRSGRSGWRITTRYVGRTVDEARWAALRVTEALDEKCLAIGGETSTPVTHESSQTPEADGDRYAGLTVWTYAL